MEPINGAAIRVIGISGKIGSGKTSLAQFLSIMIPGLGVHSFADRLRDVVSIMTGIKNTRSSAAKNTYLPDWGMTLGQLLQSVSQKMREVNPDTWVNALFSQLGADSFWVIDDLRYKNEAAAIKAAGGILIRLDGRLALALDTRDPNHISETELDNYEFDMIIGSDEIASNMAGVYNKIVRFMMALGDGT